MSSNDNALREFACARCRLVMGIRDEDAPDLPHARMCKCSGCGVDLLVWRHPKAHRGIRSSVLQVHAKPIPLTADEIAAKEEKERRAEQHGEIEPGLVERLERMS